MSMPATRLVPIMMLASLFVFGGTPNAESSSLRPTSVTQRAASGSGGLSFVLKRRYPAGGHTAVRLHNAGDKSYNYNPFYEACDMVFRVRAGRKFLVPEGTHCDLQGDDQIRPGETVTLFKWDLDECTKDKWGCTREKDLPAGRYVMRGWFKPHGSGDRVTVVGRFRIVEP